MIYPYRGEIVEPKTISAEQLNIAYQQYTFQIGKWLQPGLYTGMKIMAKIREAAG
jgi:hypothetical protein